MEKAFPRSSNWSSAVSVTLPGVKPAVAWAKMFAPRPTLMMDALRAICPESAVEMASQWLASTATCRLEIVEPSANVIEPVALMVICVRPPPPTKPSKITSPVTFSTSVSAPPMPLPTMLTKVSVPTKLNTSTSSTTSVPVKGAKTVGLKGTYAGNVPYEIGPGRTREFGSLVVLSPRSGKLSVGKLVPFCQSVNSLRKAGRSKLLSHSGKFPCPVGYSVPRQGCEM